MNQGGDLYDGCNDILDGQRVLLPIDDLAISRVYEDGGSFSTDIFLLNTENNRISSQASGQIAGGAPLDSGSHNLDFGRFVRRGVFLTEPNSSEGVVVGPNNNATGNHCPKAGAGEKLVMNFFRSGGQADCGALPTALSFAAADNTGMVWSTVVADFNKDGLDDLFVNYLPGGGYRIFSFERVVSTDITGEMSVSAEGAGLFMEDATAGDFDGDGQLEIAGVQNQSGTVQLVVLKLTYDGAGNVTGFMPPIIIGSADVLLEFGVDPGKTLGITSGDFDPSDPFVDEIVIAGAQNTEASMTSIAMIALKLNLTGGCSAVNPSLCVSDLSQNKLDIPSDFNITRPSTPIRLKTKRMLAGADMAVVGINSPADLGESEASFFQISVLNFTGGLDFGLISTKTSINPSGNGIVCLHDVAIGNFNSGSATPELMVAALIANSDFTDCSNVLVPGNENDPRVGFYSINGSALIQSSLVNLGGFADGTEHPVLDDVTTYMNLESGDLQGRSILLGDPTKVVVGNHSQPAVVIKSPPMHVTNLPPPLGTTNNVNPTDNAVIGNIITAFPELFNAEFGINAASQTFNQNNTTGYTISAQQGTEFEVSYVVPNDVGGSAALAAETAGHVHNSSVSNKYGNYMQLLQGQILNQRFDDEIMAVQKRQNVWSYPIIGPGGIECSQCKTNTTCPGLNGCPSGQAPLVMNISAPDVISVSVGSTVNIEWYQPPEVPGNVLSYPWTLAQLMQQFPGFIPLSDPSPDISLAGASDNPATVPWTAGISTNGYGSAVQHSFDTSASAAADADIFPGFGVNMDPVFNYNQSSAFSTLFESENRASSAEGFTINKNTVPNSAEVQYPFRSYIFSQDPVEGSVEQLGEGINDFTLSGQLYLGFEANPASTSDSGGAGPWWFDTYKTGIPDIALNLPAQWDWITDEGDPENPKQFRFITSDDSSGLFYFMKSFFAVPAGSLSTCPSSVPGSASLTLGPQRTNFRDGEQMLLCLRVYNLSLSDFPAGSQAKVRIYRREWDYNTGNFALGSDSELVDEINLPSIPKAGAASFGTQNATDAPNWVYASTVFDTTGLAENGDTYFKFWAVTWIENSSGDLVEELSDLGLNTVPPTNILSHLNASVEPFSNNVGVYNQVYVVTELEENLGGFPKPPDDPGGIPQTTTNGIGYPVFIQALTVSPGEVVPGDRSALNLIVNNFDGIPHDVILLYYDGDPDTGGRLFDMEIVPKVPSEDTFRVKNTFIPRSCGTHNIFVKMFGDDGSSDIAIANISRKCASIAISEAVYTPSITQLIVSGTAQGILRGSDLKLFDVRNFNSPLAVLSEEDLGTNNGLRTFSFNLNDITPGLAPCLVRVTGGGVLDQISVLGKDGCENPDPGGPPGGPQPTPTPEPEPSPTPLPGGPPIDPDDDNVADVGGVLIVSPVGTMLERAIQVLPECPDELNGEAVDYPLNFFSYEVTNINPGESVEVNFFLPEGTEPIDTFLKFGPTPDNPEPHCYEFLFDGVTGAQFLPDGEIVITFVDGERGDSDLTVNGIITDPGGPAVLREAAEPPQIGVGDCSLARTSQPTSALISLLIPLLAGLFAAARHKRRKESLSR